MLEEVRRARLDDLATLIQKTYRGFCNRRKWRKLRDSQAVISHCYKRWKDKSNIVELQIRKKQDDAARVIQSFYRMHLVEPS
jgi:myosin-1